MNSATAQTAVDLTSCDREPIHILGRIQSFGFLLAFSTDWLLQHASANLADFCAHAAEDAIGTPAHRLISSDTLDSVRQRMVWAQSVMTTERLFAQDVFGDGRLFDVAVHLSGDTVILECEPSNSLDRVEAISLVRTLTNKMRGATSFTEFLELAARNMRAMTGFDRVMIYRFLDDGSGEVIAEARSRRAESYMGLRYPASDIPKQARELYTRNTFRIIVSVDDEGVEIFPGISPEGKPLDLSLSVLRAVSPIHLEYLRNMGVGASLSVSIIVGGRLWGLFACHHMSARQVAFDRRTAAELFGELFSLDLAARLRVIELSEETRARSIHDEIMARMSIDGSPFDNLAPNLAVLCGLVNADGAALYMNGQYTVHGTGLSGEEMGLLVKFLNRAAMSRVFATDRLSERFPAARDYASRVSGVLAVPVSRTPRDYLVFFKRELAQSITWAGNPDKPVTTGPNGIRLTPRKSFEAYREIVRETSSPWTEANLRTAETLRVTLLEVILRSVDHAMEIRRKTQETQDFLIHELNHRVRNILTLIRGIVRHTVGTAQSVEEFADIIGGRIQSLARAHDQLTKEDWKHAPVRTLLSNEVDAYGQDKGDRIFLEGPDLLLEPSAYTCLALVIHEMVTNSAKYGSLSDSRGRLAIEWSIAKHDELRLEWREEGGPAVSPPTRRGFGSSIIERAIPFELNGEAEVRYPMEGVTATFSIPARYVRAGTVNEEAPAEPVDANASGATVQNDLVVLLVEDNIVIAMDAEAMLLDMGFADVLVANTVDAGLKHMQDQKIDCAILDINLGRESSLPLAEQALRVKLPVIFASGYGDANRLPETLRGIPIVTKPYAETKLVEALRAVGLDPGSDS